MKFRFVFLLAVGGDTNRGINFVSLLTVGGDTNCGMKFCFPSCDWWGHQPRNTAYGGDINCGTQP